MKRNYSFVIKGTLDAENEQDVLNKLYDSISCNAIESIGCRDLDIQVRYDGFAGVAKNG